MSEHVTEHRGSCHCGAIRLVLHETPPDAGECNCSICRRTGGLWHHTTPDKVTAEGQGVSYQQGDRCLDLWHCGTTEANRCDATHNETSYNTHFGLQPGKYSRLWHNQGVLNALRMPAGADAGGVYGSSGQTLGSGPSKRYVIG